MRRQAQGTSIVCLLCLCGLVLMVGVSGAEASAPCANQQIRLEGNSSLLPDCRAYELVSPTYTGGIRPTGANLDVIPNGFEISLLSPGGESLLFQTIQGALTGFEGNGQNDRYLATRSLAGWTVEAAGPTAAQTQYTRPGGATPQHDFSFFKVGVASPLPDAGSLVAEYGEQATLLRRPDGSFEALGRGEISGVETMDPTVEGLYIGEHGSHLIFNTLVIGEVPQPPIVQLEAQAPASGTAAIYDRTLAGTQVVSLLPGDVTPTANAEFRGVSANGSAVAFAIESNPNLYVRLGNTTTKVVASGVTFAGISRDGGDVFYADATTTPGAQQTPADLFSYDTATEATTQITNVGDARFVNVSADGSHVYFISPSQIGGHGVAGEPNLYVWDRESATTAFIATASPTDLTGANYGGTDKPNLAGWTEFATASRKFNFEDGAAADLSRTTSDGKAIVFETSAKLTTYENAGHQEVYRYHVGDAAPVCLSCGPGSGPATSNSSLQSFFTGGGEQFRPLNRLEPTANVSESGDRVFFQSGEDLVFADGNGHQDVYEWEADGTGSCDEMGGCLSLISSGHAIEDSFLYAVTPEGSDVAFLTPQELLPQDENHTTGSIYDARVGGGFPQPPSPPVPPGSCSGDVCQGQPSGQPSLPGAASAQLVGRGNLKRHRHHHKKKRRHHPHKAKHRPHRHGGGSK